MVGHRWKPADFVAAKKVLRKYSSLRAALPEIKRVLGAPALSPNTVSMAFASHGEGKPSDFVSAAKAMPSEENRFARLVKETRKPVSFEKLCDRLDMSPSKAKALIAAAREDGITVHVEASHVGLRSADSEAGGRQATGIPGVVGERQKIAVISDTHLGSKYCLREQLIDFIEYAYKQGVREILHPGDLLDGCYDHGKWELTHHGLGAQIEDLFLTLPRKPGLTYHAITGNHDETFWRETGHDVGHAIESWFRAPPSVSEHDGRDLRLTPRNDLKFYGCRGAFLKIRGVDVHLWHPKSGAGYAKSYALQRMVEKYASNEKPNILLTGHWHVFNYLVQRGVHTLACPTFQGGGSAFSKSLGGAPEIGGLILSWDLTAHGTIRNFILERRSYFEVERKHSVVRAPGARSGFAD